MSRTEHQLAVFTPPMVSAKQWRHFDWQDVTGSRMRICQQLRVEVGPFR